MKKNIWIWNHYATEMFKNQGGRHYWFAENLMKRHYAPTIFCASTIHNSMDCVGVRDQLYSSDIVNGIRFVFVKALPYKGNGYQRIRNMISFYKNLFPVSKEYARQNGKPDIILASSVHPLTLVAGIKIARMFGVPCICEVRDLWPESLVAYGALKRESIIAKVLYRGEKWIYQNADSVIMTIEGGKDYIIERGWAEQINLDKIKYINNGVMIDDFDRNSMNNQIADSDLDNDNYIKIVYTGSIRRVNNLGMLLDAAKIIQNKGIQHVRFLVYGAGNECEMLKTKCNKENINNVIFKGYVEKKVVPYILKRADINILHYSSTVLDNYGQSQNKLFEYLAAGRCIIQTYSPKYNIIHKANCGFSVSIQSANEIAKAVMKACSTVSLHQAMGANARKAAYDYDFSRLTDKLIEVAEGTTRSRVSNCF